MPFIFANSHVRDVCISLRAANNSWFVKMQWFSLNGLYGSNTRPCLCFTWKCCREGHRHCHAAARLLGTSSDLQHGCGQLERGCGRDIWSIPCNCYELWGQFRMQRCSESLLPTCICHKTNNLWKESWLTENLNCHSLPGNPPSWETSTRN